MSEYLNFWRRYADFSGRTKRREFWVAILLHIVVAFCLLTVAPFLTMMIFRMELEHAISIIRVGYGVYGLASVVPLLAISTRRLRDAGFSAKSFLWLVVPGIGFIAYMVRICAKSKADAESD